MADRLQGVLDESGELEWWMAQALDGALGAEAQVHFAALLAEQPESARLWLRWQELETLLATTPALEPATGFVRRFERRLAEQERQAHQRVFLILAAAALGALAGVAGMAAAGVIFLVYTQSPWLAEQVRALLVAYSTARLWGGASAETAALLALAPQLQWLGWLSAAATGLLVAGWAWLLRHSARADRLSAPLQIE